MQASLFCFHMPFCYNSAMINERYVSVTKNLGVSFKQIEAVLDLTREGNTIPFMARYRKEATGGLDEVAIKGIIEACHAIDSLIDRKATVLAKIEAQGKLSPELKKAIETSEKLADVEELYLPYKEKRETKGAIARREGLLPLARLILQDAPDLDKQAERFVTKGFETGSECLAGAISILSESLAEDASLRAWVYHEIATHSQITAHLREAAEDDKQVFKIYYDFSEKVTDLPDHRVLALNRGEKLGILKVDFNHQLDKMTRFFELRFKVNTPYTDEVIAQALKKKIIPAMQRRVRAELTEKAEEGAIRLFSDNLRQLLLVPPLKGRVVLGFDPAFRTGAKLAVVDETGKLLMTQVIYPVPPANERKIEASKEALAQIIRQYQVTLIAIGNGTASRESEQFVAEVLDDFPEVHYAIVNESGASVYSASDLARKEFPDLSVEKRSAISIARRLQDPLAELVKIDPKSIGVGQYQHDVNQKRLTYELDFVVEMVVNQVGVNVNTASPALLSHVAGLTMGLSQNIVDFREAHGKITRREMLKKVPRLGPKAYEQAAGFLRVPESENVLDNTGVHPESYPLVDRLFAILAINNLDQDAQERLSQADSAQLANALGVRETVVSDMLEDLQKPGRDMRDNFEAPLLRQDILDFKDLSIGQELEGVVRNIVDFGAFVDIGVHDDGLIHISHLSKRFIAHPSEVLSVGDVVTVWVIDLDNTHKKIGLSLVSPHGSE